MTDQVQRRADAEQFRALVEEHRDEIVDVDNGSLSGPFMSALNKHGFRVSEVKQGPGQFLSVVGTSAHNHKVKFETT